MADLFGQDGAAGAADGAPKPKQPAAGGAFDEDSSSSDSSSSDSDSDSSSSSSSSGSSSSSSSDSDSGDESGGKKKGSDGGSDNDDDKSNKGGSDDDAGFVRRKGSGKGKLRKGKAPAKGAGAGQKKGSSGGKLVAAKKRKRGAAPEITASRYLDIGAEEAEEEDEDLDEEERGQLAVKRTRAEEAVATKKAYERIRAEADAQRAKAAGAKTAEELAAMFEKREKETGYIAGAGDEGDEDGDYVLGEGEDSLAQHAALPDMRDPKLWMVGCKEGEEASVLIALCNKFLARDAQVRKHNNNTIEWRPASSYQSWQASNERFNARQPLTLTPMNISTMLHFVRAFLACCALIIMLQGERLGIMSAVQTSKGRIFVEAYREAQVSRVAPRIDSMLLHHVYALPYCLRMPCFLAPPFVYRSAPLLLACRTCTTGRRTPLSWCVFNPFCASSLGVATLPRNTICRHFTWPSLSALICRS